MAKFCRSFRDILFLNCMRRSSDEKEVEEIRVEEGGEVKEEQKEEEKAEETTVVIEDAEKVKKAKEAAKYEADKAWYIWLANNISREETPPPPSSFLSTFCCCCRPTRK
ncbi:uncharacterized protein LOC143781583 isoform X2 [Ranitomeya variabilis]|uniref:uncharacterized protein LOC143781581 isoform X2 n=1 Tax=Ranitomeya variabilis TaxID=490064 RepID=UPI00405775C0